MPRRKPPEVDRPGRAAAAARAAGAGRGPGPEPAGAPDRRPQPGDDDRPGHQHLPRRHRRDRGHRPRPRRPDAPRRHRRLRRRSHPLDRLHPHPPRPLARRGRPQGAHRGRGAGLRLARRARGRHQDRATAARIEATEFRLRAVHTPGHASNHLCYLLEEERVLFSGDHIMQGSTVVISPPDGNMAAVPRVAGQGAGHPPEGHRPRPRPPHRGPQGRHRRLRRAPAGPRGSRSSTCVTESGTAKIDDLVEVIYADINPDLHPVARKHRARPPAQAGQGRQGQGPRHRRQVDRPLTQPFRWMAAEGRATVRRAEAS